jgi:hypothetical protein
MTPDTLIFDLVEKLACISISPDGHANFLVGNDLHDITHTNLGRWLLETQGWSAAQSVQPSQWPETSKTIQ